MGRPEPGSKTESIANSRRIIERLQELPPGQRTLGADNLLRWHRGIFRRVQSPIIGRFRTPDDEPVGFGVPVLDEHGGQLKTLWVAASPPDDIPDRLAAAFARYEAAVAAGQRTPEAASHAVAALQTEVITTHPFVDGNSRTTNVLVQAAIHDLSQPELVTIPRDWKLAAARSYAVRPDGQQSIEPLADLMAARLTAARGG